MYVRALDQFEAAADQGLRQRDRVLLFARRTIDRTDHERGILRTISLADGLVTTVTDGANFLYGGAWGDDDRIVFVRDGTLWQIARSGGNATQLTKLGGSQGDTTHSLSGFCLAERHCSCRRFRRPAPYRRVGGRDRERRTVVEGGRCRSTRASGHLVFVRDGELLAAPFDPDRLEVIGTASQAIERLPSQLQGIPVDRHFGDGHGYLCANGSGEPSRLGVASGRRAAAE